MKRTGRKQEWSLTLFAFGVVMFLPPVIGIYNRPDLVLGLPLTFVVLFGVWTFLIIAIYVGARPAGLSKDSSTANEALEPRLSGTDSRPRERS